MPNLQRTWRWAHAGHYIMPSCQSPAAKRREEAAATGLHPQLWAAVLTRPEDDGLRLVFADWLEDNGQTVRAEFIRLQCRLCVIVEKLPRDHHFFHHGCQSLECLPCSLRRSIQELVNTHAPVLVPAFPVGTSLSLEAEAEQGTSERCWTLRRGFVEGVTCSIADWYGTDGTDGLGPALVGLYPLTDVHLSDSTTFTLGDQLAYHCPRAGSAPREGALPRPIFELLDGKLPRVTWYDQSDCDLACYGRLTRKFYWDLASACLTWARDRAQSKNGQRQEHD
jgi:uncharacterized protein (TIGR02996 family)